MQIVFETISEVKALLLWEHQEHVSCSGSLRWGLMGCPGNTGNTPTANSTHHTMREKFASEKNQVNGDFPGQSCAFGYRTGDSAFQTAAAIEAGTCCSWFLTARQRHRVIQLLQTIREITHLNSPV